MAIIDGLIGLLDFQRADALVLQPNAAPTLIIQGFKRPVTMPPLDAPALAGLVEELLSGDEKSLLGTAGSVELAHVTPRVGPVTIHVRHVAADLHVRVTRGAPRPAVVEPAPLYASPPTAATPDATAPTTHAPVAGALWAAVGQALQRGASDIWLRTGAAPRIRVAGTVEPLPGPCPTRPELLELFAEALSAERRATLERSGSVDLAIELEAGHGQRRRLRVNLFDHAGGLTAALRPLWHEVPTLEALHLPRRLCSLVERPSGLVLLAGVAGSGKSTTAAVLLEHVNETRAVHLLTLEDPIEYVYPQRRAIVHQREVGTHCDSFASGLRAALRESPDVLLVGEMRDPETIALALTAAETGHLVVSTLHASSAATAVDRVVDVFPDAQQPQVRTQLANVLRGVITQRLLPGTAPGLRVPAIELLVGTHAVGSHIREGRTHLLATCIQSGGDDGMLALDRSLVELVRAGVLSRETALEVAQDKEFVRRSA